MSLNDTPLSERKHIAFFGRRNAGKSSLINAVTGQKLSIVSDVKGTTTDPVYKTMELLPAGPVVFIDTPGLDDEGELGAERVKKAVAVFDKADLAVLVADGAEGLTPFDTDVIERIKAKKVPYLIVFNKCDLTPSNKADAAGSPAGAAPRASAGEEPFSVSALTGEGIYALKERIATLLQPDAASRPEKPLVADLVAPGSFVVLVVPIDKAAPKGRLILPQQQVIRDLLDNGSVPVVVRDSELAETLQRLPAKDGKPDVALVITDSQAFKTVAAIVPEEIPLTSFSILFSRYKGELDVQLQAVSTLDSLKDGDTVLIAEGCTHHRQCGDIGTEKIPRLLKQYTGKDVGFQFTSGTGFPDDLSPYAMVIHCGGCMLNEREMKSRIARSGEQHIPITNYGMALAKMTGILDRSMMPLKK